MKRSHLSTLLALLALMALSVTGGPAATSATARPGCVLAGSGLVDNFWQDGDGNWSDPAHWTRGVVPGLSRGNDYACIGEGVEVTVGAAVRVDLTAIELGPGSTLVMSPGSALMVWGDQATQRSLTRLGSTVDVRGATLGGSGLIHVIGTVAIRSTADASAQLASYPAGDTAGPGGRLVVGDEGTVDVQGDHNVGLTRGYTVEVHGRSRLLDTAALVAAPGTGFELRPHLDGGKGVGRFVIRNDRGYLQADLTDAVTSSSFVNEGRIVKRASTGTSVVAATYSGSGAVVVKSGYLVLPDAADGPAEVTPGASVGSGTCTGIRVCGSDTTPQDQQFASLKVPTSDSGGAQVVIIPLTGADVPGAAVGVPIKVHAKNLAATRSDPAVIKLRYDRTLLRAEGRPADPDQLNVLHAANRAAQYVPMPSCDRGAVPPDATACVDRRPDPRWGSRKTGGDVIMVVRTIDTSRWLVR